MSHHSLEVSSVLVFRCQLRPVHQEVVGDGPDQLPRQREVVYPAPALDEDESRGREAHRLQQEEEVEDGHAGPWAVGDEVGGVEQVGDDEAEGGEERSQGGEDGRGVGLLDFVGARQVVHAQLGEDRLLQGRMVSLEGVPEEGLAGLVGGRDEDVEFADPVHLEVAQQFAQLPSVPSRAQQNGYLIILPIPPFPPIHPDCYPYYPYHHYHHSNSHNPNHNNITPSPSLPSLPNSNNVTNIIVKQQIFKILKSLMSSVEYYRLALLQQLHYRHQLQSLMLLQDEISDLKLQISARHKKHRRCDKEITKAYKCAHCEKYYASDIALKLHLKLKHARGEEKAYSTEDSHCQNEANSRDHHQEGPTTAL